MKQPSSAAADERIARNSKIYLVPICEMRVAPVHITQREFRAAWGKKLAADLDLSKLGYPVINRRDGIFWILDGQHRIYALRQNGFEKYELSCEVFEGLTDEQAAKLFLGRNDVKPVAPFDKFRVSCTAGDLRSLAILRSVESQGAKISRERDENCVSAVAALGRVYDLAGGSRLGEVVLGQVIRTIKNAFAGDPKAFDGTLIVGLGLLYNRFNGKTDERALAKRLSDTQLGVRGLIRRAEAQRQKTGNQIVQCIAATVVDEYNKHAGTKHKLPSWWKEATNQ